MHILGRFGAVLGIAAMLALPASSLAAQTPVANGGWEATDQRDLHLNAKGLAMSPDGRLIAGANDAAALCIWDVETLDPTCLDDELPIDLVSLAWSPDSSAIAFSLDSARRLIDSDVYVVDVASGELQDLTDDGDAQLEPSETGGNVDIDVDVYPSWSPDGSRLVFARSNYAERRTRLMTIPAGGDEPDELEGTTVDYFLPLNSPIFWRESGAMFYFVSVPEPADDINGVWRYDPDGSTGQIMPGNDAADYPAPRLTSIAPDDAAAFGFSALLQSQFDLPLGTSTTFVLDLESGEVVAAEDALIDDPKLESIVYPPRILPDGSAIVYRIDSIETGQMTVFAASLDGESKPRVIFEQDEPYASIETAMRGLDWADNNTILIPMDGGATLVTVAPTAADATPAPPCSCTSPGATPPA